jgi:hypothetical protein
MILLGDLPARPRGLARTPPGREGGKNDRALQSGPMTSVRIRDVVNTSFRKKPASGWPK